MRPLAGHRESIRSRHCDMSRNGPRIRRVFMKQTIARLTATVMILSASDVYAQARPTFAGKWTLVPDRTQRGGDGGCPSGTSSLGQQFTATQTSSTLTIESMQGPP